MQTTFRCELDYVSVSADDLLRRVGDIGRGGRCSRRGVVEGRNALSRKLPHITVLNRSDRPHVAISLLYVLCNRKLVSPTTLAFRAPTLERIAASECGMRTTNVS